MAVHTIIDPALAGRGGVLIADRALYTDASRSKLLEEGDADAAILVVSHPGKPIPAEFVDELGLEADAKGKVKQRKAGGDKERRGSTTKDATPPANDGTAGAPIVAAGAADLDGLSKTKLKELAKERKVPGYSSMDETELRAALVEGGEMQQGGVNPDQAAGSND